MTPLSREALSASGETFRFHPFYGHRASPDGSPGDGCFSQWWPCRFEVAGVVYVTAEQFMMAAKARLFRDDEALRQILEEADPAKVKRLGRSVRGFDDPTWKAQRFDAASFGNVEKFSQDGRLRALLLATGDEILVEASPRDQVWGVGLGRGHELIGQPGRWRGQNLLGFALVRARGVIRGDLPPVQPGPWLR